MPPAGYQCSSTWACRGHFTPKQWYSTPGSHRLVVIWWHKIHSVQCSTSKVPINFKTPHIAQNQSQKSLLVFRAMPWLWAPPRKSKYLVAYFWHTVHHRINFRIVSNWESRRIAKKGQNKARLKLRSSISKPSRSGFSAWAHDYVICVPTNVGSFPKEDWLFIAHIVLHVKWLHTVSTAFLNRCAISHHGI